eukprot:m.352925 g.352925  ORF g.352925 m.352925 type:complete len:67 (-) comp27988_c0_seq3:126-326(-)
MAGASWNGSYSPKIELRLVQSKSVNSVEPDRANVMMPTNTGRSTIPTHALTHAAVDITDRPIHRQT